MFLGRFVHTIDEKGRLTIPSKFRTSLADGLVITPGLDRCLYIFPLDEWDAVAEKIRRLPMADADSRALVRFLFSGASDDVLDRQGRVVIPAHLREYAALGSDVVVAGSFNRLEVWNREAYQEVNGRIEADAQALAQRVSGLGIL